MAAPKKKAAAAVETAPKAVEDAPPNEIIQTMQTTAALVESTLLLALREKIAITLLAGPLGVQTNRYGDVDMAGSAQGGGNSWQLARQAGLFLGAARAIAVFHETDNGF